MKPARTVSMSAAAVVLATLAMPAAAEPKRIGLAVANLQADFFNEIKQAVEAYGKTKGVEIITVDAKGDATTQVDQVQDLITRKIDALIYIPAGATAAAVPVKAARKAKIPIVNVDRNAAGAPGDTFFATDGVAATRELGDWVCKQAGGKGNAVIIKGQQGTTPQLDRSKGWAEAMAKCPGIKVSAEQYTERWAADEGAKIAQDMLQRDPTITVIFGQADGIALGASRAVKLANLGTKVWVVGFDGDPGGLMAVKNGALDATVTQQTQKMGRMAVDAALELIAGKKLPAEQLQGGTLTTKTNVAGFIANHP